MTRLRRGSGNGLIMNHGLHSGGVAIQIMRVIIRTALNWPICLMVCSMTIGVIQNTNLSAKSDFRRYYCGKIWNGPLARVKIVLVNLIVSQDPEI